MKVEYDYCLSWLGVPYVFGGETREGIDCSGLAQKLLKCQGYDPPGDQTAQKLYEYFLERSHKNIKKFGSLAFYGFNEVRIEHVGFLLDSEYMIEAIGHSKIITPTPGFCVEIGLVSRRKDLVAILSPFRG